eukprot:CAMPEP_0168742820 /NCGR_PEP_ID=MMETSP0724-20121128/13238_1 /TAXON_ID=265536 /ORGANISM="Amphiprora sp., Strain CCMP467" /LENGTH=314 /DNA_ID=CAMNT_0008790391 /DNA_START=41 /DNA_END=985 /DNA_ORIENTATION=-
MITTRDVSLVATTALVTAAATAATLLLLWTGTTTTRREDGAFRQAKNENDNDDVDGFRSGQETPPNDTQDDNNNDSNQNLHVRYHHERLSLAPIRRRAKRFLTLLQQRRSLRFFSNDPIPRDIIETLVQTAATAPSGAHKQPWSFVAVSHPDLKRQIRRLVEEQETINYQSRMKQSWVADVETMVAQVHDTEHVQKPYLTEAPWLLVVLKQPYGIAHTDENGQQETKRINHYYVPESVGIACGMLIAAIHNANLVTLTSTPMGAEQGIRKLLGRPDHEKVMLLLPVGFPAHDATVPYRNPERKPLDEVLVCKCS